VLGIDNKLFKCKKGYFIIFGTLFSI